MGIVGFFHRFKFFRNAAKVAGRNVDIKQKFHHGYIFLNAVEHSWAWTGKMNYTTFDATLQKFIYEKSKGYDYFIDIGSNIGVMTIGTLLHNDQIKTVAVEPNDKAVQLLKKSLSYNKLNDRCEVINAVVGADDGVVKFDPEGSVTGHVADEGQEIGSVKFSSLLNKYGQSKTLVKIDIEGYETVLMTDMGNIQNLANFTFIMELHELNFNGAGDPVKVLDTLQQFSKKITGMEGEPVSSVRPEDITQVVVEFS